MLVLSRKETQSIILVNHKTKDAICVTNVELRGTKARIGIQASLDWKVLRNEHLSEEEQHSLFPEGIQKVNPALKKPYRLLSPPSHQFPQEHLHDND